MKKVGCGPPTCPGDSNKAQHAKGRNEIVAKALEREREREREMTTTSNLEDLETKKLQRATTCGFVYEFLVLLCIKRSGIGGGGGGGGGRSTTTCKSSTPS